MSSYSDDGLDLSQDLDALIDRLKHMNAQTLAVSSEKLGLTPKRGEDERADTRYFLVEMLI